MAFLKLQLFGLCLFEEKKPFLAAIIDIVF